MTNINLDVYYEAMNAYRSKVYDFNTDLADNYLSEAIVDFEYAVGNNGYMSLRISHHANDNFKEL